MEKTLYIEARFTDSEGKLLKDKNGYNVVCINLEELPFDTPVPKLEKHLRRTHDKLSAIAPHLNIEIIVRYHNETIGTFPEVAVLYGAEDRFVVSA
jgi:nitrogen fixation protein